MPLKTSTINTFLIFKLPSAFLCGVRVKSISETTCTTTVKHRWINQNPFKSMYWAVQGMAAELSTGALVMSFIKDSDQPISMLVASNKGTYFKKAKGRIDFVCEDGEIINQSIKDAIISGEGVSCWMRAIGTDHKGEAVSQFDFEWTLKLRMS